MALRSKNVLDFLIIHRLMSPNLLPPISLYIHIPWCLKKCPYCDFNSHAVKETLPEHAYIDALLADLDHDRQRFKLDRPIETIFIGGGTPSLFSAEAMDRLLHGVRQRVKLVNSVEVTLEANPGTFESSKFGEFRALGINRLSIGIQSFDDPMLKALGRVHSSREAIKAVEIAHLAGFDNINLDLMFGLPGASVMTSCSDMETAIRLQPKHISFYQLTLEPNTYFHRFPPPLPEEGDIVETQVRCQGLLAEHNYRQYEISAYSFNGSQCQHNLNYWQFGDYLGIGAGAHGKISLELPGQIVRTIKPRHPERYLSNFEPTLVKPVALADLPLEFVMNHLRLRKGFSIEAYQAATGLTIESLEPALSNCLRQGLLIENNHQYVCSEQGWNFLDSILHHFLN